MTTHIEFVQSRFALPGLLQQSLCLCVAFIAVLRFSDMTAALLYVALPAGCWLTLNWLKEQRRPELRLTLLPDTLRVTGENGNSCQNQLIFAVCDPNHIVLQTAVWVNGQRIRQEWVLKRTKNSAKWRLACQRVQWFVAMSETKKPQPDTR